VTHPAGSPEAIAIVRGYLAQRARLSGRGLGEAERALERRRRDSTPRRRPTVGGAARLSRAAGRWRAAGPPITMPLDPNRPGRDARSHADDHAVASGGEQLAGHWRVAFHSS
jgi:hypothetical protein